METNKILINTPTFLSAETAADQGWIAIILLQAGASAKIANRGGLLSWEQYSKLRASENDSETNNKPSQVTVAVSSGAELGAKETA